MEKVARYVSLVLEHTPERSPWSLAFPSDRVSARVVLSVTVRFSVITSRVSLP